MNLEFKNKLLALYPLYDKVTGPYLRKDGRKHIVLNNSTLPNKTKGKLKTLSWPKALIEVHLNRLLEDYETADHIDEDFTNDDLNNLQVLTRAKNIIKSFNENPERYAEYLKFNCFECNEEFLLLARQYRGNQLKQNKAGPFCSRQCSGIHNQRIQSNGHLAQLVEATDLSSVK